MLCSVHLALWITFQIANSIHLLSPLCFYCYNYLFKTMNFPLVTALNVFHSFRDINPFPAPEILKFQFIFPLSFQSGWTEGFKFPNEKNWGSFHFYNSFSQFLDLLYFAQCAYIYYMGFTNAFVVIQHIINIQCLNGLCATVREGVLYFQVVVTYSHHTLYFRYCLDCLCSYLLMHLTCLILTVMLVFNHFSANACVIFSPCRPYSFCCMQVVAIWYLDICIFSMSFDSGL